MKSDPGQAAKRLRISRSEVKEAEGPLERKVSDHIRAMQILSLPIEDAPGPESARGRIERNAIALLSNYATDPLDRASAAWLGLHSDREKVVRSGLWNNRH